MHTCYFQRSSDLEVGPRNKKKNAPPQEKHRIPMPIHRTAVGRFREAHGPEPAHGP